MSFWEDLATVLEEAEKKKVHVDKNALVESFGKGTYRWLIEQVGVNYSDGMDIGIFDLHQNYDRKDMS